MPRPFPPRACALWLVALPTGLPRLEPVVPPQAPGMQTAASSPMEIPRPVEPPPANRPPGPAAETGTSTDGRTAPGAPVVGSPGALVLGSPGAPDLDLMEDFSPGSSSGGSPHSRRRGRPRKGEEMTEEERKARRKEINRLAARRAHQKKLDVLSKLESARHPPLLPAPTRTHILLA